MHDLQLKFNMLMPHTSLSHTALLAVKAPGLKGPCVTATDCHVLCRADLANWLYVFLCRT